MGNPVSIDTTVRFASMRQIHCAIEHMHRGDFECATTLAAAAEGILPPTAEPHTFQKVMALEKSLPDEDGNRANDIINWLKHGTLKKGGKRYENVTISEQEMISTIVRAISKFGAIYRDHSPQMRSFIDWAIAYLQDNKNSN